MHLQNWPTAFQRRTENEGKDEGKAEAKVASDPGPFTQQETEIKTSMNMLYSPRANSLCIWWLLGPLGIAELSESPIGHAKPSHKVEESLQGQSR